MSVACHTEKLIVNIINYYYSDGNLALAYTLSNISGSTFIEERKERVREREGGPY